MKTITLDDSSIWNLKKRLKKLIQSERDQYISFRDSRDIYHELNTQDVRVIQISEYHRIDKSKKVLG